MGSSPPTGTHPYLRVSVRVPGIQERWTLIEFLVDTGAATTAIHPTDALHLLGMSQASLDASTWPRGSSSHAAGIGGLAEYLSTPAEFAFSDEDGRSLLYAEPVKIAAIRSGNQHIPSLLGWDLLRHFELTVHGRNQTVTLDPV